MMRILKQPHGYTFIEICFVVVFLVLGMMVVLGLMSWGISAGSRGKIYAQTRKDANLAIERVASELRQATPLPIQGIPAVILPGPGNQFTGNPDGMSVGCNVTNGCTTFAGGLISASTFPNAQPAGTDCIDQFNQAPCLGAGPGGFLIFSEVTVQPGSTPDQYTWVMYEITPPTRLTPSHLMRYTFPASRAGAVLGLLPSGSRDDVYFNNLANSNEGAGGGQIILSLGEPIPPGRDEAWMLGQREGQNYLWMMVSHGYASANVQNSTGDLLDPELYKLTVLVTEAPRVMGIGGVSTPRDFNPFTDMLSTQVKLEGTTP